MSSFLSRLKNLFTVNPDWSTSILPPNSFRVPSPGSIFGYTGAERKSESFTSGYAYFKRDSRRSFPATVLVTHNSITGLLSIPDNTECADKNITETVKPPPVAGKRRVYRKADDQPPSSGYFPIINCE